MCSFLVTSNKRILLVIKRNAIKREKKLKRKRCEFVLDLDHVRRMATHVSHLFDYSSDDDLITQFNRFHLILQC